MKQRVYPMLGFKSFAYAVTTISGIELVQRIRKGQIDIAELKGWVGVRVLQVWESVRMRCKDYFKRRSAANTFC